MMRNKDKLTTNVRTAISQDESLLWEMQADICQTLANPKRLQILNLLKDGELSVSALVEALGMAKPNLSQHLGVMRQKGILATRREGTAIYYRLVSPLIIEACRTMRRVLLEVIAVRGRVSNSIAGEDSGGQEGEERS
jgi:ArsR family transcriptional regulator, virulence genes transcriptional regulator